MSYSGLPLVSDQDLGAIEPLAIASDAPWGASTWPTQRAQALRTLKVWLEADFGAGAADRLVDRWSPSKATRYTSGVHVDITSDVSNDTEEDVDLSTELATVANDRIYVGLDAEFDGLFVQMLDSLNAAASVLTVSYWGPTGWTALTIADGTTVAGATFAQSGRIRWTVPANWTRRRLAGSGSEYLWVQLAVSAALTSGTAVTQILPTRAHEGLRQVAAFLALGTILKGFALQAPDPERWRAAATEYEQGADGLYTKLKTAGGLVLDQNADQVAEPSERKVVRTVVLQRG